MVRFELITLRVFRDDDGAAGARNPRDRARRSDRAGLAWRGAEATPRSVDVKLVGCAGKRPTDVADSMTTSWSRVGAFFQQEFGTREQCHGGHPFHAIGPNAPRVRAMQNARSARRGKSIGILHQPRDAIGIIGRRLLQTAGTARDIAPSSRIESNLSRQLAGHADFSDAAGHQGHDAKSARRAHLLSLGRVERAVTGVVTAPARLTNSQRISKQA